MGALLLLVPWSLVAYMLYKHYGPEAQRQHESHIEAAVSRALIKHGHRPSDPSLASYANHLDECALAASHLNLVRPAAIAADVNTLLDAPAEAVMALSVLAKPMDALTIQRDLNTLGADPKVPETGVYDRRTRRAVAELQSAFSQEPTGEIDPETAIAIRYSVGVIHGQDQMGMS
jgi:hypothetical protein